MVQVESAWIFDVDGVITDLEKKVVAIPEIFDELIKRLKANQPIALVTGRALEWLLDRVVSPLEERIRETSNLSLLDNFYVSSEFGGSYLLYEYGKRKQFVDKDISVPQRIVNEASKIVEEQFTDYIFVDPHKKTHFSAEMKDGIMVRDFTPQQRKLTPLLAKILDKLDKESRFELHVDRIATNIRDKRANKSFATRQVMKRLSEKGIKPKRYIAFGDAVSDLEIPEEISRQGIPVEFVFVGEKEAINIKDKRFPIIFTRSSCDKGTLEYLQSENLQHHSKPF